ncbi:MAG: cytochrome C biogenesis protein [Parcubacteria group bacterium CG10_big_fil_rev_8_21_14_0_10_41_35]|nr:MAG: cytochrome C biogenesis protein [Parcubacteria group bacterium CG10_big_fil_rev_8_21_14_0_10_41_35]
MHLSIYIALSAGLVSFLSPCVLPIIPGFLAYLAGTSGTPSGQSALGTDASVPPRPAPPKRSTVFLHSVLFVLGFSFVFALLGVLLNTVLERVAYDAQIWIGRVGGIIIIFFGLYLIGLIKPSFLQREHKVHVDKAKHSRYVSSFLFGAAFAAGWTPCVGAALGAILGLAATHPASAFSLLMFYAIGLGLPFLVVGLFASSAQKVLIRFNRAAKIINILFGILLIILGMLIFTGNLSRIANFELLNQFLLR